MTGASSAFASFEQKWLAAYPENAQIAVFLPAGQRPLASAFGSLVYELIQSARQVREPLVAATKLAWWQQELADASGGQPRHPITQLLFADAAARAVDPALWPALAHAAQGWIERAPAASLAESLRGYRPFFVAVARVESALFLQNRADIDRNATLWTLSQLLHDLSDPPDAGFDLPLDMLATHALARTDLATVSTARNALLRDYLDALQDQLQVAAASASVRSLSQRVRMRLDRALIAKAKSAPDPIEYLRSKPYAGCWLSLWIVWREARKSPRYGD